MSQWLEPTKAGDLRAFARLLTQLEREGLKCFEDMPELLHPVHLAFRLGITGPPGAGKSTLISKLIGLFRASGMKVGVLAVDPSSPFSKGAVLGDRIRYHEHFNDPGVFIRSLGSRGSMGGLSFSAYMMVRAFDLARFDLLLIETVGVGQTELEIMNVADFVSVVLVPESGDAIQGMKAGLLEIADLFIVNKGDRDGADAFAHELESTLGLDPRAATRTVPVLKTTATSGEGLDAVLSRFQAARASADWRERRQAPERLRAEATAFLRATAEIEIFRRTVGVSDIASFLNALKDP